MAISPFIIGLAPDGIAHIKMSFYLFVTQEIENSFVARCASERVTVIDKHPLI
jgi:hypothetical protein